MCVCLSHSHAHMPATWVCLCVWICVLRIVCTRRHVANTASLSEGCCKFTIFYNCTHCTVVACLVYFPSEGAGVGYQGTPHTDTLTDSNHYTLQSDIYTCKHNYITTQTYGITTITHSRTHTNAARFQDGDRTHIGSPTAACRPRESHNSIRGPCHSTTGMYHSLAFSMRARSHTCTYMRSIRLLAHKDQLWCIHSNRCMTDG